MWKGFVSDSKLTPKMGPPTPPPRGGEGVPEHLGPQEKTYDRDQRLDTLKCTTHTHPCPGDLQEVSPAVPPPPSPAKGRGGSGAGRGVGAPPPPPRPGAAGGVPRRRPRPRRRGQLRPRGRATWPAGVHPPRRPGDGHPPSPRNSGVRCPVVGTTVFHRYLGTAFFSSETRTKLGLGHGVSVMA